MKFSLRAKLRNPKPEKAFSGVEIFLVSSLGLFTIKLSQLINSLDVWNIFRIFYSRRFCSAWFVCLAEEKRKKLQGKKKKLKAMWLERLH